MDAKDEVRKNWIIDLIKDAGYGCLATIENDQPHVRPMMPYLSDEGQLLLAVLSHSRTIEQIKKNPKVEMCFIDRKMSFCRVSGNGKVSDDFEKKEIVWENIPMLRNYFSGPADQNYVLIEIDTSTMETMTPTQKSPDVASFKLTQ
ncbi:MAG: pyridoxamine 5'-phosphate oxidase family protein [Candidatus Omnitrophica bacterium]|nr:pyridoxamine 5'-phosphate oxidase family protein [Candidatus Omnitrophota bacterium]